ncbi:hypothetical protein PIB30_070070 [Stylosanthes scabra]|uniref:Uncharacterized protein n=1 Tax=Stylosanthes scabra TaxID=79078 RepID=A0ABU6VQ69_9FABA|nr:hypothetical protein [Stylosanthes scabra]
MAEMEGYPSIYTTSDETNERWKHTEATNKANRASEKAAKYTGRSSTPMQTKTKSLDRPISMIEVFK